MSAPTLVVLVALAAILLAAIALERGGGGAKELALIATLGAAAAAGRLIFAPLPSVKPVTVICLVAGATLGVRAGLAVGPIAALVSNTFLGQGPWTPPQMALWALVGLSGALLAALCRRPLPLAAIAFAWGMAFGWAMNLWSLAVYGPEVSWSALEVLGGRSLPFDLAHAIGNVLFALAIGPALARLLMRYRQRIRIEVATEPATAGGPRVLINPWNRRDRA